MRKARTRNWIDSQLMRTKTKEMGWAVGRTRKLYNFMSIHELVSGVYSPQTGVVILEIARRRQPQRIGWIGLKVSKMIQKELANKVDHKINVV